MAAADVHVEPALSRRWGRRPGRRSGRSRSASRSSSATSGWFAELPDDVALKVAGGRRTRSTRSRPRSSCSRRGPTCGRAMGAAAAGARARARTPSSASPSATSRRSSRSPAAARVADAVLGEVSAAAADGRDRARLARGPRARAAARRGRPRCVTRCGASRPWAWLGGIVVGLGRCCGSGWCAGCPLRSSSSTS